MGTSGDLGELRDDVTGTGRCDATDLKQESSVFDKSVSPWDGCYFRVDP